VAAEEYQYALLRVVPDIARGERLNVGVILHCRRRGFLDARVRVDPVRLRALAPGLDAAELEAHLRALLEALPELEPSERFHWLAAPSSTIIQPSEVHTGLTEDPAATLERLFSELVG
jgi:hypothetical protein